MTQNSKPEAQFLIAATVVAWLAATVLPGGYVRLVLALPLVLWLPGYALLALVHRPLLKGLAGACFCVGSSLSLAIALGYLLNSLGLLGARGWSNALAFIVLLFAFMASRTKQAPDVALPTPLRSLAAVFVPETWRERLRGAIALGALCIAGAAYSIAKDGATNFREFKYSELWVIPKGAGREDTLKIGIKNMEGTRSSYELELRFDGKLVGQWKPVTVEDGAEWLTDFSIPYDPKAALLTEARLFKSDDPDLVYRQTWLTLRPKEGTGK